MRVDTCELTARGAAMPCISIFHGDTLLLEHRLRPGRTTIGRADQCDIALPGTTISRLHCTFRGNDKGWRVDDHSRHGTWVDGVRVDGHMRLADGATVKVGDFTITLVLQAAGPAQPHHEPPTAPTSNWSRMATEACESNAPH